VSYPDQPHGYALKGNLSAPATSKAASTAFNEGVAFLSKHLLGSSPAASTAAAAAKTAIAQPAAAEPAATAEAATATQPAAVAQPTAAMAPAAPNLSATRP
jgi:hypothetical protein